MPRGDQFIYLREVLEETPVDGNGPPRRFVDEIWYSVDGSQPSRVSERGRAWMEPAAGNLDIWAPYTYAALQTLPTDPAELRRVVRGRFGPDSTQADQYENEYSGIYMLLTGRRLMPPGLQAAAYRALAQIPGVDVVDDAVNLRGRRGIGVSRTSPHGPNSVLILDRDTYDYLGTRTIYVSNEHEKVVQLTARVENEVVDKLGERPPQG